MDNRVGIVQNLMKDEGFAKELFAKVEPEEVQALFESNGVSFTLDEIRQIGEMLARLQSGELDRQQLEKVVSGELSEDELEEAAGGIVITTAVAVIAFTLAGATAVVFYEAIANLKKW